MTIGFKLTTTPQRVLDGTKAGYIQETKGRFTRYVVSASAPTITPNMVYHTILNNDASFPIGFPVWAWTDGSEVELAVSTST